MDSTCDSIVNGTWAFDKYACSGGTRLRCLDLRPRLGENPLRPGWFHNVGQHVARHISGFSLKQFCWRMAPQREILASSRFKNHGLSVHKWDVNLTAHNASARTLQLGASTKSKCVPNNGCGVVRSARGNTSVELI